MKGRKITKCSVGLEIEGMYGTKDDLSYENHIMCDKKTECSEKPNQRLKIREFRAFLAVIFFDQTLHLVFLFPPPPGPVTGLP